MHTYKRQKPLVIIWLCSKAPLSGGHWVPWLRPHLGCQHFILEGLNLSLGSASNPNFLLLLTPEKQQQWLKQLGYCPPPGNPRLSFLLLALAQPHSVCLRFARSETADGRSLVCICLPQNKNEKSARFKNEDYDLPFIQ